ncbi:SUMF1/EgtB/PvdO family nonheme iron enzyme, partial [Prochlorothrix hollandica]|uniref:SUMF1/EgtB/PvdO family nonheme iron enzyme n=1 Tax=Prochlorothrix hollandica TaxID=1223 RepID=UPI0033425163
PDLRTPPQAHKPGLSQGVNDAIVQALSLYPDQRPSTMEQWLQALGQAHRAAPPSPSPKIPSPPPVQPVTSKTVPAVPSPKIPSPPPVQPVTAKTVVAVPPPRVPPSPVAGLRTETVTVEVLTGVDAAGNGGQRQAVRVQRWLEDLGGGVTLALVQIPAGSFVMGSPEKEQKRDSDEGPQHRVNFPRDFWLGQFAVTQAQYQAVMGKESGQWLWLYVGRSPETVSGGLLG